MPIDKNQDKRSLKIEILEKLSQLITTGFGIVAALAWNDTIRKFFERFIKKPEDNLLAMLGYSIIITILVVLATVQLSRLIDITKKQHDKEKKDDEDNDKKQLLTMDNT